jgi:hypothetical protein
MSMSEMAPLQPDVTAHPQCLQGTLKTSMISPVAQLGILRLLFICFIVYLFDYLGFFSPKIFKKNNSSK